MDIDKQLIDSFKKLSVKQKLNILNKLTIRTKEKEEGKLNLLLSLMIPSLSTLNKHMLGRMIETQSKAS